MLFAPFLGRAGVWIYSKIKEMNSYQHLLPLGQKRQDFWPGPFPRAPPVVFRVSLTRQATDGTKMKKALPLPDPVQ